MREKISTVSELIPINKLFLRELFDPNCINWYFGSTDLAGI